MRKAEAFVNTQYLKSRACPAAGTLVSQPCPRPSLTRSQSLWNPSSATFPWSHRNRGLAATAGPEAMALLGILPLKRKSQLSGTAMQLRPWTSPRSCTHQMAAKNLIIFLMGVSTVTAAWILKEQMNVKLGPWMTPGHGSVPTHDSVQDMQQVQTRAR